MKIGIDIRSTLKKSTGIGKYTLNLINALAEVDSQNNYFLYSRKKLLDFKRRLPKLPARNFHHSIDYFKKGPDRVLPNVDVFHASSCDLQRPKRARFILTVHDVIIKAYPYGHSKHTINELDGRLRRTLSEADAIVVDSYNTKSDLMKFYEVTDSEISVIYPGVNPILKTSIQGREVRRKKEDFILFVGTLEPRKNVDGLIKAFTWLRKNSDIKHKLYIIGMKGWMFESIFKAYEESEFKKDIVFKGYVKDEELKNLYRDAAIFAFPSFYEGFGFPIIEAFSAGIPVVTSRTSSCGEIAKDAALLIDPDNYKEIGEAILKLINDENLKEELVKKGIDRVKEFLWINTANKFLKLFTH